MKVFEVLSLLILFDRIVAYFYEKSLAIHLIGRKACLSTLESSYCDQKAWERGFTDCSGEICDTISTDLPVDIEGTLFR
jgi:hypothetical protein